MKSVKSFVLLKKIYDFFPISVGGSYEFSNAINGITRWGNHIRNSFCFCNNHWQSRIPTGFGKESGINNRSRSRSDCSIISTKEITPKSPDLISDDSEILSFKP